MIFSSQDARIIEKVPFYPQEKYQCGPASLAGVLNFWGIKVSVEEISTEIFSRGARGTLNIDMVLYAQRKGLRAEQYAGHLDDIRANIRAGFPLIVLVDEGFWVYQRDHFMVVIGYDDKGIIVNSGKEPRTFIPWISFQKTWEKTKFWTLKISPK